MESNKLDILRPKPGVIATVGMFDGVHTGHMHLLRALRSRAHVSRAVSLAVTFDPHPLSVISPEKAPRLLCSVGERAELLRKCGVDRVVVMPFTEETRRLTAVEFMAFMAEKYGVTRLLMGYDHGFGSDRLRRLADYQRAGAAVGVSVERCTPYILPGLGIVSSSAVRRLLAAGDVSAAARMLGRRYTLNGKVIHGRAMGRRLGFPTANLCVDSMSALPLPGVYACKACVGGIPGSFPAMVNIGTNPTVVSSGAQTVEAHIIDFDMEIYGRDVTLHFVSRLRSEQRFGSLDALREQLAADRTQTLDAFI